MYKYIIIIFFSYMKFKLYYIYFSLSSLFFVISIFSYILTTIYTKSWYNLLNIFRDVTSDFLLNYNITPKKSVIHM